MTMFFHVDVYFFSPMVNIQFEHIPVMFSVLSSGYFLKAFVKLLPDAKGLDYSRRFRNIRTTKCRRNRTKSVKFHVSICGSDKRDLHG